MPSKAIHVTTFIWKVYLKGKALVCKRKSVEVGGPGKYHMKALHSSQNCENWFYQKRKWRKRRFHIFFRAEGRHTFLSIINELKVQLNASKRGFHITMHTTVLPSLSQGKHQ